MSISRQHDETELHEIIGENCRKIIAIPSKVENIIYALYLEVGMTWLRLFINAELLFVDECGGPDPEDDLAEMEEYVDYGLGVIDGSSRIQKAIMKNGIFTLTLSCGIEVTLEEVDEGTRIKFHGGHGDTDKLTT